MPDIKLRVTVHLDPDQYKALEAISRQERISISALLRQAADLLIKEKTNDRSTSTAPGNETP